MIAGLLLLALVAVAAHRLADHRPTGPLAGPAGAGGAGGGGWLTRGQAAYLLSGGSGGSEGSGGSGGSVIQASPAQSPVSIASVAKVMTAYLVVQSLPLDAASDGPALTVSEDDVADTKRRADQDESVVAVSAGEQLSERQALQAVLLPSANNVAVMLARFAAGSTAGFVAQMNAKARALGMTATHYTDPSGFDAATVSTARDQVILFQRVIAEPVLAAILALPSAELPVAGRVKNTNALLGRSGVIGGKTGSDDAAGGCFAFESVQSIDGREVVIVGVVLGQRGGSLIAAGLAAAQRLIRHAAGSANGGGPAVS